MATKTATHSILVTTFFKKIALSSGVKITYKPVTNPVIAAVECVRPVDCVMKPRLRSIPRGIATRSIFKLISLRTLGLIAIKTRVAIANLVPRKSFTGWRSSASFISTNAAPQTAVTDIKPITAQILFRSLIFWHVTSLKFAPLHRVLVLHLESQE